MRACNHSFCRVPSHPTNRAGIYASFARPNRKRTALSVYTVFFCVFGLREVYCSSLAPLYFCICRQNVTPTTIVHLQCIHTLTHNALAVQVRNLHSPMSSAHYYRSQWDDDTAIPSSSSSSSYRPCPICFGCACVHAHTHKFGGIVGGVGRVEHWFSGRNGGRIVLGLEREPTSVTQHQVRKSITIIPNWKSF